MSNTALLELHLDRLGGPGFLDWNLYMRDAEGRCICKGCDLGSLVYLHLEVDTCRLVAPGRCDLDDCVSA